MSKAGSLHETIRDIMYIVRKKERKKENSYIQREEEDRVYIYEVFYIACIYMNLHIYIYIYS